MNHVGHGMMSLMSTYIIITFIGFIILFGLLFLLMILRDNDDFRRRD